MICEMSPRKSHPAHPVEAKDLKLAVEDLAGDGPAVEVDLAAAEDLEVADPVVADRVAVADST